MADPLRGRVRAEVRTRWGLLRVPLSIRGLRVRHEPRPHLVLRAVVAGAWKGGVAPGREGAYLVDSPLVAGMSVAQQEAAVREMLRGRGVLTLREAGVGHCRCCDEPSAGVFCEHCGAVLLLAPVLDDCSHQHGARSGAFCCMCGQAVRRAAPRYARIG